MPMRVGVLFAMCLRVVLASARAIDLDASRVALPAHIARTSPRVFRLTCPRAMNIPSFEHRGSFLAFVLATNTTMVTLEKRRRARAIGGASPAVTRAFHANSPNPWKVVDAVRIRSNATWTTFHACDDRWIDAGVGERMFEYRARCDAARDAARDDDDDDPPRFAFIAVVDVPHRSHGVSRKCHRERASRVR